jgi:membrane protein
MRSPRDAVSRAAAGVRAMLAGIARARTLGLAAEMSFWLFLAIVPLAAVAGFVAARLATGRNWLASSLLDPLPEQVRALLRIQVEHVAGWHGGAVAPIAAATFVWAASTGVQAVFEALEVQTGTPRPWWRRRMLAIATCILLSLGTAILALLAAGLDWVEALAGAHLPAFVVRAEHGVVGQAIRFLLAALVAVAMTCGLYRVAAPRSADSPVRVLPGAVLSILLQLLLGWGYGRYISRLGSHGGAYQAGLGAIAFTMMTFWLFSIALLLGAQLNCVLADRLRRSEGWHRSAASSSRPTSPRPPAEPSIGPSSSPHA